MKTASELLEKYGSPLYVYKEILLDTSCKNMKAFAEELKSYLPGREVSMHYSPKANSSPVVLNAVKAHGLKVDCMSPGELYINEKCGFDATDMLYVCNNIKVDEMKLVHDKGLTVCFDSVSQVDTWGKNFPGTNIMVRINPGVIGVGHSQKVNTAGPTTKFGISEANLPKLFEVARRYNLRIIGTHQHLGSLFLNDRIPDYIAGVKANLNIVKKHFSDLEIVDLGGGFGVPYKPGEEELDLQRVIKELTPILKEFITECSSVKEFKFEPGRYIPCQAGNLLGTVTAVEDRFEKYWIGTDVGMGMLVRPSMYDSYHKIVLPESEGVMNADVCGDVCESGDVLGRERLLGVPEIGDPVIIFDAGAYGYSMASNYTGRTRPAEVLIKKDGEDVLIRKRETVEQIYQNIVWENI